MRFEPGDIIERGHKRYVLCYERTDLGRSCNWFAHEFRKSWGKWNDRHDRFSDDIFPHMLIRDGWTHFRFTNVENLKETP